ncbi:unnamed protein product [Rodentolepis nana]|uniref:Secreted protein n=1 Tax=Rodentolepis nana TaxID=102285 RepID=A0A0R3T9W6_RODNA|nr:unnamed protein product [Rodentolepis nana]
MKNVRLVDRRYSCFNFLCFFIFVTTLVLGTESRYIGPDMEDLFSANYEFSLDRKPVFRNVQELRRYLEQLDEWLAITGRPRFG